MQTANIWLGRFSKLTVFSALVLIVIGSLVTTNGAGMAFPDWPLSNGSLNPSGWLTNLFMLLEHGHRLVAGLVATLVLILFVWVLRNRGSLPRAAFWFALSAVVGVLAQAVLGGFRVTVESGGNPQGALILRVLHGCFAQIEFALLVVVAAILSTSSAEKVMQVSGINRIRNLAWMTFGFIFLQLVCGATMRHMGAGLAIPFFPHASSGGAWMPPAHNAYVDTNFTHTRFLALLVVVHVVLLVSRVLRTAAGERRLRQPALVLLVLVAAQVALGIAVIWSLRGQLVTTLHVVNGALVLSTSLLLALRASQIKSLSEVTESFPSQFPTQEATA